MTLRQALARQWQIPVFLLSLVVFVSVLARMRPKPVEQSFEDLYGQLTELADQGRFAEFYPAAESLRLKAETQEQLGRVHRLAARTRVKELTGRRQFGFDDARGQSAQSNYENVIHDYRQALQCGTPAADSAEAADVFAEVGLAFWSLNQADRAKESLLKAIELRGRFDPALHRLLVRMHLASRGSGYLANALEHLELLLASEESSADDKSWSLVRKAEVLIGQGREDLALELLNNSRDELMDSPYGSQAEFLRGMALRYAGELDQADLVLRDLIDQLGDRGDTYAQTALELAKINYQQYRDFEAARFYEMVVSTQMGKDWYAAGKRGLAECAAMQRRYDEAVALYNQAVDLVVENPNNRAVTAEQIRMSLASLAERLSVLKQFDKALMFLEIEKRTAPADDIRFFRRLALAHARMAGELLDELGETQALKLPDEPADVDELWLQQQHQRISEHFEAAAEQYLKVADGAYDDAKLYADSIWEAASCYDKAGNVEQSIKTWGIFVEGQQGQSRWPFAVFNLAQSYQASGKLDDAIRYYQLVRAEHPVSIAALKAMVPLAKCFLAKEPAEPAVAKELLKELLADEALTPTAPQFRGAMFELGMLHYNNGEYMQAISILTEAIERYPHDPALGKAMFLVGDSYRQSGIALDQELATLEKDPTATVTKEKTFVRRRNYLDLAREYFDRAVGFYEELPVENRGELDNLYLRQCWLYRADCLFDLEQYSEAVKAYEAAALHYQLTPTALTAFMQIINCHIKLGNSDQARSANQRAVFQLRKIPDETLAAHPGGLNRNQWAEWFDWVERSGLL